MSIIIDACTISAVFNPSNSLHSDFKPVADWLKSKKGFLVIGGTTYKNELKAMENLLRYISEIQKARQIEIVYIDDLAVDSWEAKIKKQTVSFKGYFALNDHHIIALLAQSGCCLLCSSDKKSFKFIKDRNFYPKNARKAKIYTSAKLIALLDIWKCEKNKIKNKIN